MKTKTCHNCKEEHTTLYRIQIRVGKEWIFCCKSCTEKFMDLTEYRYGGTWKGYRH